MRPEGSGICASVYVNDICATGLTSCHFDEAASNLTIF